MRRSLVVISAFLAALAGCAAFRPTTRPSDAAMRLSRFEYSKIYMGMRTRLVVYASDETAAVNACRAAFDRIGQLEDVASDYRRDSELMRLCATAATRPVKLSEDLYTLLSESQRLAELTDGAFDVTVGPYVQLWRKARKEKTMPATEDLEAAAKLVGWRKLQIDPQTRSARLAVLGMKLDLGGIAKGYAGDCAIRTLRENGIASALFEAGGDIVVSDAPPDHPEGWKVELIDPEPDGPATLALHNCAISTSGDTMQFVEIDGKHYSHVVDPRTGLGLTTRAMATVVAPKGLWSDPLSKPAGMLSAERWGELAKHYPGVRAYVRVLR